MLTEAEIAELTAEHERAIAEWYRCNVVEPRVVVECGPELEDSEEPQAT